MTGFIAQQTSAEGPRIDVVNDYSAVQIAEPYARQAPQMTGWANMLNDIDPLWPRTTLLGVQDCFADGASVLAADHHRWEWNFPPGGAHRRKAITGTVVDSNSAAVSGATVYLYNTATGLLVDTQTSASDGTFTCTDPNAVNCMAVAYKTGTPDLTATSANTLTGT